LLVALALAACAPAEPHDDPAVVPPVFGAAVIEPWLAAGYYLQWTCDPAPQPALPPAPAGMIRTCANPIAAAAASAANWPVDSAWVLERYDTTGAVTTRFVQRRSEPDAGSASWYWYGDDNGVLADGWGFDGAALTDCSACHALAGTGSNAGHELVFRN
jgi:hypothetical protein